MGILEEMLRENGGEKKEDVCDVVEPNILTKAFESFNVKYEFKPGQLIKWKSGMQSSRIPYGVPIVFMGYKNHANKYESEAGSNHQCDVFDCEVGMIRYSDFVIYAEQSQRWEPYKK